MADQVQETWRSAQYFLAGTASLALLLTFLLLPETHHRPLPHTILKEERGKKFVPYIFNPFTSLGLFRWPNICCIVSASTTAYLTIQTFVSSCVMFQVYCLLVCRALNDEDDMLT